MVVQQDLKSVAFPKLDEGQIAQLGNCGGASPRRFEDGQTLFRVGDRDFKFFVVKSRRDRDHRRVGRRSQDAHGPQGRGGSAAT